MSTFAERLYKLRRDKKLARDALGLKIGVSKTAIKNWEDGENLPKVEYVKALAEFFDVSFDWLATGEGGATDITKLPGYAPISEWDDRTAMDEDEVAIPFYKDIAFACGHGAVNGDVAHEARKLRMGKRTLSNLGVMPENAFAATARDDSMMPYVQDGDTIYIDKGRKEIKDGRIFAIRFGELCLCKRLYRLPDGGVRIVSDNSDEFPEQIATKQQVIDGEFEVIGWVWSVSRLERW